ncbi:SH3 domain-containing protein [Egbenema bharatensis]|uniref:SH3 domain-containing protein n=1 Tax=Egbenema bharatensis TaxID=3463334 RepID=UPI003A8B7FF9
MTLSGVSKFFLGIVLAAAILFGAGVTLTRYLLARLSTPPPRPVFANDPSPASAVPEAEAEVAVEVPPEEAPVEPEPEASPVTEGYPARVIQPIGLILREEPSTEAAQVGGIEFNQDVVVLESSEDGGWQRVRLSNGAEGWVRGGNTERRN